MENNHMVLTNEQTNSGKWEIFADDNGTRIGIYDDPSEVRAHLCDLGLEKVDMDVDGNGSFCAVPVEWIGDGEPLIGSKRALALV